MKINASAARIVGGCFQAIETYDRWEMTTPMCLGIFPTDDTVVINFCTWSRSDAERLARDLVHPSGLDCKIIEANERVRKEQAATHVVMVFFANV